MQVRILKLWHQWSWLFHICAWTIGGTVAVCTYGNATASNTAAITEIQAEHLPVRMAVQEQTSRDITDRLVRMETVQGKIFDRVNQIADRNRHD